MVKRNSLATKLDHFTRCQYTTCRELLKCICKNKCQAKCRCRKAGLSCTALCSCGSKCRSPDTESYNIVHHLKEVPLRLRCKQLMSILSQRCHNNQLIYLKLLKVNILTFFNEYNLVITLLHCESLSPYSP